MGWNNKLHRFSSSIPCSTVHASIPSGKIVVLVPRYIGVKVDDMLRQWAYHPWPHKHMESPPPIGPWCILIAPAT